MKSLLASICLILCFQYGYSQTSSVKVILEDSTRWFDAELRDMLKGYLIPAGVESADNLDYTKRCEYYIAKYVGRGDDFELSIRNCERRVLGTNKVYGEIRMASEEDMAKAIASEIVAILKSDSSIAAKLTGDVSEQVIINHHSSRHFFAPTAYNLKKGELYYSTYFGLQHEAQYGLSDNFSVGAGTTVGLIPIYVTPKLSFKLIDNVQFSIGDLFASGTYVPFIVNLAYSAITIGSETNNVTLSGGVLHSTFGPQSSGLSSPTAVLNLSTMQSFSRYVYLVSENYYLPASPLIQENNVFAGFTGMRFIRKQKDVASWQVGILYLVADNRLNDPTTIVLPGVSYTHKFGMKL